MSWNRDKPSVFWFVRISFVLNHLALLIYTCWPTYPHKVPKCQRLGGPVPVWGGVLCLQWWYKTVVAMTHRTVTCCVCVCVCVWVFFTLNQIPHAFGGSVGPYDWPLPGYVREMSGSDSESCRVPIVLHRSSRNIQKISKVRFRLVQLRHFGSQLISFFTGDS